MEEPKKIPHSRFILSSLNYYTDMFADTDRVTAEHIGSELKALAKILGFGFQHEGEIEKSIELWLKLFSMSHKLQKTGNWLNIIPVAIKKIDNVDIPLGLKIRLLNRMGQVYRFDNQFQQAEKLHQKALAIYEASDRQEEFLLADCNFHLAENHLNSNHPDLAVPHLDMVLGTSAFNQFSVSYQATALVLAGLVFNKLQQFEKAADQFQNALRLWENENDSIELARTYSNLGHSYLGLKSYDDALKSFTNALGLFEDFPFEKARSLSNLGVLHYYKNEFLVALKYWKLADDLLIDQDNAANLEAGVKHNIGVANRSLERYQEAVAYFAKAIKLRKTSQDEIELARSFGGLGETYLLWGKYQLAIDQYDIAIDLAQAYPSEKIFLEETRAEREEAWQKLQEFKR